MGDSGLGKTFVQESLKLIIRCGTISSQVLGQLFQGKPCFGDPSFASSGMICCPEIQLSQLFSNEAKEFLDVTQSTRKINIKYESPVSISQGVSFCMCTNEYLSDVRNIWSTDFIANDSTADTMYFKLKQSARPTLKRICFIPFVTDEKDFLNRRNYIQDFGLSSLKAVEVDQKLSFIMSLIGAALMIGSRVNDYMTSTDNVQVFAQYEALFSRTYLGIKLKHMTKAQYDQMIALFYRYCCYSDENILLFSSKQLYRDQFRYEVNEWMDSFGSLQPIKNDQLESYQHIYTKNVRYDTMKQRVFHIGYDQKTFTKQLVESYIDKMLRVYRVSTRNQLTVTPEYLSIVKQMNFISNKIPKCIKIDSNIDGKRNFIKAKVEDMTDEEHMYYCLPVMQYFVRPGHEGNKCFNEDDYCSEGSDFSY